MKFIYYSDSNLVSTDVLSDCDHSLFKVISSEAEVMKEAIAENILLIVLNKPPSNDFIEWHKKNSEIKLILFTKDLTEAYLRDLQNEHYFYDLFYKYPISFFEVENNLIQCNYVFCKKTINFEIYSANKDAQKFTGNKIIKTDTIPVVKSWYFQNYQKAVLKK